MQEDLDSLAKTANQAIYTYMQGPSEFTITGTLKTYDATPLLRHIKVPTLYTVGEYDEADPATVKRFATEGGSVLLKPEHPTMKPIVVDPQRAEFRILGKVIGLIREM